MNHWKKKYKKLTNHAYSYNDDEYVVWLQDQLDAVKDIVSAAGSLEYKLKVIRETLKTGV